MSMPKEHDYIGLSETSSSSPMELKISEKLPSSNSSSSSSSSTSSCTLSTEEEKNKTANCLNLKETELRLGLPGSHSHSPAEKKQQPAAMSGASGVSIFGKDTIFNNGFSVIAPPPPQSVSGAKRGFSDAIDGSSAKWVFSVQNGSDVDLSSKGAAFTQKCSVPEAAAAAAAGVISQSPKQVQEEKEKNNQVSGGANENTSPPAAKAQVVGWPPIRSFRKNSMASNLAKNNEEAEGKPGVGCVYVKVSMDGAPYLRKVDLKTYSNYVELSSALEKMFSCFTIGQCGGCHGLPGRDGLSNSRLKDLLQGSEYVLTYEDKDGDWMLVGDVPWEMFTETCRRMRIMKGSEAIGLAPRTVEKCKNHN